MDQFCNQLVNPRDAYRYGDYRRRLQHWMGRHLALRQGRPGWGEYALFGPVTMIQADKIYQAPRGMGRGR